MSDTTRQTKVIWIFVAVTAAIGFNACVAGGRPPGNEIAPSQVPVTPDTWQAVIAADVAVLRSGPGIEFRQVGTLARGVIVTIVGTSPARDWYLVMMPTLLDGISEAWISGEFVAPAPPDASPTQTYTSTSSASLSIQLLPPVGEPGMLITVSGAGWRPADVVYIGLDDPSDGLAAQVDLTSVMVAASVTDRGDFIAAFTFPSGARWVSLPEVFVIAQSSTTGETASAVFHLSRSTTTQTPTPCGPPSNWTSYVAQPGDTLSSLSRATGASIQELMSANCLRDDRIFAGHLLFVPHRPITTPTATLVPHETPIVTPTATPTTPTATPTLLSLTPPTNTATPTRILPSATPMPSATASPTLIPAATPTPTMPPSTEVPPSGTPGS